MSPPFKPVGGVQLLVGVILPFICFAISYPDSPVWQSGVPSAYAQLLLSHKASVPLYPFLLYSMSCMVLLFVEPARFRDNVLVRFGVLSGVLVAAEYWLIFLVAAGGSSIIQAAIVSVLAAVVPWGTWQLLGAKLGKGREGIAWGALALLLVSMLAMPVVIFACLWCSTPWALAAYLITSFHLIRGSEARSRFTFSLAQLLGAVTWFGAHCSAWRVSFTWMLEEYSRLPTTPPQGCFVCTAVANGHPRVVHGEHYLAPNGTAYRVNDQLRVLKGFELLLVSVSPKSHRACRRIYDRLGPRLAAPLVHPLLADLGYFVLKPAEWTALVCLGLAIPGKMRLIYSLYPAHESLQVGPACRAVQVDDDVTLPIGPFRQKGPTLRCSRSESATAAAGAAGPGTWSPSP
ncbi:MAG: DUF6688 family protein [Thermoguttaceae bacterium]